MHQPDKKAGLITSDDGEEEATRWSWKCHTHKGRQNVDLEGELAWIKASESPSKGKGPARLATPARSLLYRTLTALNMAPTRFVYSVKLSLWDKLLFLGS